MLGLEIIVRGTLKTTWRKNERENSNRRTSAGKGKMKHTWFNNIRHYLFGHQVLWGRWVKYESFDGCSVHATCIYCGYKGMIDSQGNLF